MADAGQLQHPFEFSWEGFGQHLSCGMCVACARIVAKSLPRFYHFQRGCLRESFDVGKSRHPALEIWNNRFNLRLLEHDLRNPDRIRIKRPPPRQIAGVFRKPLDQGRNEAAHKRRLSTAEERLQENPSQSSSACNKVERIVKPLTSYTTKLSPEQAKA